MTVFGGLQVLSTRAYIVILCRDSTFIVRACTCTFIVEFLQNTNKINVNLGISFSTTLCIIITIKFSHWSVDRRFLRMEDW